jgi:hypothetical protein
MFNRNSVGGSHVRRSITALSFVFVILIGNQASAQTKRALVIGINTYQPEGTNAQHPAGCTYGRCDLGQFPNLQGAVNDAQSMADILTSPKFGFPTDKVVLLTNPAPTQPRPGVLILRAAQTDRDGILAAMQKYLVDVPQPGDTVVFYYAGHGSLRINSQGTKLAVPLDGKFVHADSTLVPADAYKGGYDVRDREMARIFNAALDKGIHLTVILDSCHSGGTTRGILPKYNRERDLAFDPRDINEAPDVLPNGKPRLAPTERPDNPALVLSAVQQDQSAKESSPQDSVTEPHGAFTAALLESLQVLPADVPASVISERVKTVLEGSSVPDQEPDLDATVARGQQPLFGGTSADSGKVRTAALNTNQDGSVWLDIGRVSGIGIDSEFTSMIKTGEGQAIKLRVTDLKGIARSTAKVVSPPGAKIAPGEVFELTKWVPAQSAPLFFWFWPSKFSEEDILAAAAQVEAAGVVSISDPAEEPWTDILCWDDANSIWTLQHAGSTAPITLGAKLTADALRRHLSAGAKLWVNLPPSKELSAKLAVNETNSAVQFVRQLADANYILTGVLTKNGPAYAWFHKNEFAAGPRASVTTDHSPGCSSTSQYPVRRDWVAFADATALGDASTVLNKDAALLAKAHGWFELAGNPIGESTASYYKLGLVKASDQTPAKQPAREGDTVELVLQSSKTVTEKRWVYVLDIDCHGKGSLIYPIDASENRFPTDATDEGSPNQIILHVGGDQPLTVGEPYGVDTLILLSTHDPLPDPSVLNFEGATRGKRGIESPLEQLLTDASEGTRSVKPPTPTNWGLTLITLQSIPQKTGS